MPVILIVSQSILSGLAAQSRALIDASFRLECQLTDLEFCYYYSFVGENSHASAHAYALYFIALDCISKTNVLALRDGAPNCVFDVCPAARLPPCFSLSFVCGYITCSTSTHRISNRERLSNRFCFLCQESLIILKSF